MIPGTPPFNFIALSNVLYPDGESVSYVYDYNQTDEFYSSYFDENDIQYRNTGRLIKVISNDGTELIIKYADAESNRVKSLLKKKGNSTLQKIELDSHNTYQRIIKTNDVQEEIIQYNHNLDPLYRRDNSGVEYYYDYDSSGKIVQITLPENADNLLLNGNFEDYDDESWKPLSEDESYICPEDETSEDSNNWYYIKSDTERLCGIYQKIQINGKLGDSFGISAFGMANEIIPIDTRSFGVEIFECDSNGTFNANEPPIYTLYFDTTISNELQYRLGSFTLEKDVENIAVCIVSSHQSNPVYVDNVKLYKASSSNIIDFDDAEDEEITSTCTCANCKYEYDCLCDCSSEIDCTCVSCVTFSNSIIDANGNIIKNTFTDGTKTLESESTYTSNGNYICKEIDENGNEIIYTYNINNGTLEKITDANDIDGIGDINYTYNAMGVLVKVSQTISAAQEESYDVNYIYSNDKLTSINHNNATYVFEYDDFGNCIKTKIVDTDENVYNETNYTFENFYSDATLNSITYSNGHKISYSYDDGNINAIYFDDETTPRYEYNYDENGVVLLSKDNTTGISTIYTEDGGYSISRSDGSIIYSYGLNDEGLISENIFGNIYVNGNEEISPEGSYTYDYETGITQKEKFVDTPLEYHTHSIVETDTFERTVSKRMLNENDDGYSNSSLNVLYTYHETDNQTTKQISSMQNNYIVSNDSLYASKYDCFYDGCGNISMVNRYDNYGKPYETMHTDSYEYDAAGQLIRENNYSKGTFVYSYDEHGNICEVSKYSYTLEENLGEETDSTTFTYDTDWKDLLLYHNEKLITYDEMGNPLTYGNDEKFEWQGRLLKSYTTLPDPLDTSCDFKKYVFSYDGEGNRTVKTVYDIIVNEDGTMSEEKSITYYYLWEDNRLIAQQSVLPNGNISNTLKYLYDANNEAYGFVINNNNIIYYIKDNLGNVKSLFSKSNGEYAVNYYYDAWGNVSYSCNTSSIGKYLGAMVLAMNNSITYKGYCFDEDADLYYLGSRYYNSKWCRFLNPDIYYDTGDAIIGTNVFAYCNNNPVNYYDDTGTWAKDVHSGKDEPKIDGVAYGTYTWAKECKMNTTYAKYLADKCNEVDNIFFGKSFMPYIGDQSWHFNVNAGTGKEDSRITNAKGAKKKAMKAFADAQNSKTNKDKKKYTKEGLKQLGLALHATQWTAIL